ncbi:MAG: frc 14 [Aeromicrobium sp.]|nr:frc 14 [Aeromicrobium sp.]
MAGSDTLPLQGIRVVEVSPTLASAFCTQFLSDAGADVVMIEPPRGTMLRVRRGWPMVARGKRSVVADLMTEAGRAVLAEQVADADVLLTAGSPDALERLGMNVDALTSAHPDLVVSRITGWGQDGPWRNLAGYEGLVMAKTGLMSTSRRMQSPPRPTYVSVPYASYAAGHIAVHGILTALLDRTRTGRGQVVDADMVRGIHAIDAWNWFGEMVGIKWPDAYVVVEPWSETGEPRSPMVLAILCAPTKDGHWLQFAQVSPRLFQALLSELDVLSLMAEPRFRTFPDLESPDDWRDLWHAMLRAVGAKTLAEWQDTFSRNPDLSAAQFLRGSQVLDHPQLVHDGRTVEVLDPTDGPVRQPTTLIHTPAGPLSTPRSAPRVGDAGVAAARSLDALAPLDVVESVLPLEGVTILEFGEMFAAPYATSVLSDLGARVIKFETMTGDSIRSLLPFPESAGAKVMQGKESIQVDLHTDEGQEVVRRAVLRADIVMQSMRAGAAQRMGVDCATLAAINPDITYVNAPGYGTDGPYGASPAYAPSIAAATGVALANVPSAATSTTCLDDVTAAAPRLLAAGTSPELQADGLAALSVASTMLLGLLGRERGIPLPEAHTSMMATVTHVLADWVIDGPDPSRAESDHHSGNGPAAIYRSYDCSQGLVFLAVPKPADWDRLMSAPAFSHLGADPRFVEADARHQHDDALAAELAEIFALRTAAEWEALLTPLSVGCVEVETTQPARLIQTTPELASVYATTAYHPVFDDHLRLAPLVGMSRSSTRALGGCLAGSSTRRILEELGYDEATLTDWLSRGIIST